MADEQRFELKKPLNFLQKAYAGAKGFVKGITEYLPKGIVSDALLIAGGIAVATYLGFNPVGLLMEGGAINWGAAAHHAMISLSLVGALAGAVGATKKINDSIRERDQEIAQQRMELEHCRDQLPQREFTRERDEDITPPSNLPPRGGRFSERG